MCGIWGYFGKPTDIKKTTMLIKNLAIESQVRGTDSTGFFAENEENSFLMKSVQSPGRFIKNKEIDKAIESECYAFLGHNRLASCGSVVQANAHPFHGEKYVLIHNGHISQKNLLQTKYKIKSMSMKGNTDSETLLRALEKVSYLKTVLSQITGYSIVLFDRNKGKLIFARDSRYPMIIAQLPQLGIRVFCSTAEILEKALVPLRLKEDVEYFSTLPFNIYEGDPETKEVTRRNKYDGPVAQIVPQAKVIDSNDRNYFMKKYGFTF